jgi:diguanylate cyclase (GGDEF)-like protein
LTFEFNRKIVKAAIVGHQISDCRSLRLLGTSKGCCMKAFYKDRAIWMIVLAVVAVFAISARINLFERVYFFTRAHESWDLDELFAATFFLPFVLPIVLYRSNRQLRVALADKVRAEQRANHIALHDDLTGLPNRRFLKAMIDEIHVGKSRQRVTTMMIDLDRFKDINDKRGHEIGDLVLIEVANRLIDVVADQGTVIRLGGDEFVALIKGLEDQAVDELMAEAIISAVTKPMAIDGEPLSIACSVGVAMMLPNMTQSDLLRRADLALYASKAAGGARATHQTGHTRGDT